MVFTRLSFDDKQAFFELLDEYFTSRPEIFANSATEDAYGAQGSSQPPAANQAASAVHRALAANPEATASLITAGLRHSAAANASAGGGPGRASGTSSAVTSAASNPEISNAIGRVAAASLAFSAPKAGGSGPGKAPPPPVLPRRTSTLSSSQETSPSPPPAHLPPVRPNPGSSTSEMAKLVTKSSFGLSPFGRGKTPTPVAPPVPSAFPKRQLDFAPPPVRKLSPAIHDPEPDPEPEEEEGEWAEALYDYDSGEAGDLVIRTHDRIKLTGKDSDDWWSGEIGGRSGLFPASYVKPL